MSSGRVIAGSSYEVIETGDFRGTVTTSAGSVEQKMSAGKSELYKSEISRKFSIGGSSG